MVPGENGGTALANVLFGNVSPSGKLPITIDRDLSENPAIANFPMPLNYDETSDMVQLPYSEGLYFGYRGYEKSGRTPLYPFGFGLSYTNFRYSSLHLNATVKDDQFSLDVSFDVTNEGQKDGAEIAQVYVGERNPKVDRPTKELKGFEREIIKAGETKQYTVHLPIRALSYYEEKSDSWRVDAATFDIGVGASSADIKLHSTYRNPVSFSVSTNGSTPIFDPGFKK